MIKFLSDSQKLSWTPRFTNVILKESKFSKPSFPKFQVIFSPLIRLSLCSIFFFINQAILPAQSSFYHPDTIQNIHIYFEQDNWDELLDELYIAGEKERLLGSVTINGEVLDSVGIRYKGFSSVSVDRIKNPFNIKLDFIKKKQKYDGIDKIKLSNVIQDPSFIREVLSYEIARNYMPASRANFANVYVNDTLFGLYTNVEAVNKDFIDIHFSSNQNAFFKCDPENLDFDGENSNLGNSPGSDTTDYYPFYDKESDAGWTELVQLIDILNEHPEDIESILNVDRTLWMHAFNYALINFDSYVGYAQNYYLYQDDNGQFNSILWDMNQSFASYRLADASEHFDGFTIAEAKAMDPLLHHHSVSVYPRPLMRNLFANDTYRRMYLAHLRTIIKENFSSGTYASRAQTIQDLIDEDVAADEHKFYTYDDFINNLNITVSDLVNYPGITDLMEGRIAYLENYPGMQGAPIIDNITTSSTNISIGDHLSITANVSGASSVMLAYRYSRNDIFTRLEMLDDGSQNDDAANDGIYGIQLTNVSNSLQYYIYAENEIAGQFSPERAAYEFYNLQSKIGVNDLVINEFMASNDTAVSDESGDFDDWIELYNTTESDIATGGLYLSDNPTNLTKWAMPDVTIPADSYLIIWADEDGSQGDLHANFKLSANGEALSLAYTDGAIIDEVTFGEQITDISTGRLPNGTGPFVTMNPTFNGNNDEMVAVENVEDETIFSLFPNPTKAVFYIKMKTAMEAKIEIRAVDGTLMKREKVFSNHDLVSISTHDLATGLYYVSCLYRGGKEIYKLIIL